ncbi:MAG: spoIIQ 3 [Acidobacteria bacterium]|nr:spoIIQ 3 [Acidobacteriota bacterium]
MKDLVEQRSLRPTAVLILLVVAVLVWVGMELLRVGPPPEIVIRPAIAFIGKRTPVTVEIAEPRRGLSYVGVELVQGNLSVPLAAKNYDYPSAAAFWSAGTIRDTITAEAGREKNPGLKPGEATIRVTAGRVGTWLRRPDPVRQEITLPVRLSPPALQVISTQTYVAQGGCEAVVYRVDDSSVHDGVRAGKWWFPGYPLPGGEKGARFAIFAIPYDMNSADARLMAFDASENQAERSFIDQFFPKEFKQDAVELSEAFLNKVVPEIMSQTPELQDRGNLLDNYLAINRDLRQKNAEALLELAQKPGQEMLWSKPFVAIPNGKVMAGFADSRTYLHQGNVVDRQTHLGYDLAVTRRAPVPAANDGIVALARYFGIYGNAVVINHGCGIMSLYGHLSNIGVTPGQKVARGDTIGQTGETGLAGGDHLHFAVILDGLPVNPVEWWDGHWIADRIARKLGPGFPFTQ